jgi:hypothetical protein
LIVVHVPAAVLNQHLQYTMGLGPDVDLHAVPKQPGVVGIQAKGAERNRFYWDSHHTGLRQS